MCWQCLYKPVHFFAAYTEGIRLTRERFAKNPHNPFKMKHVMPAIHMTTQDARSVSAAPPGGWGLLTFLDAAFLVKLGSSESQSPTVLKVLHTHHWVALALHASASLENSRQRSVNDSTQRLLSSENTPLLFWVVAVKNCLKLPPYYNLH